MNVSLMHSFKNISSGSSFFFSYYLEQLHLEIPGSIELSVIPFLKNGFISANMFCCYDNSVINIKHLFSHLFISDSLLVVIGRIPSAS